MALNEKTKEAIAIVLDVGPSMSQAAPGCATSLQTAITAVTMILQRKLFAKSSDEVALILFGTPGTTNDLAGDDEDSYSNITLARNLGAICWELLEYIQNEVQPSNVSGDFVDAIVVAMDHLHKATEGKKGFTSKRVILCSDLGGEFGDDGLSGIIAGMKKTDLELNVIGPHLDELDDDDGDDQPGPSNGQTDQNMKQKTPQQNAGEQLLRHMMEKKVNIVCYSFSEAIPMLSYFQSRSVKPTAWKVTLDISCNLQIPVCGYTKVKEQKAASFKNVCARSDDEKVNRSTSNHLNDENETEIEATDIAKGLRYGNTLVPFSADDEANMKFKAVKCLKVLGFTKNENVRRQQYLGDSVLRFVGEKDDEHSQQALSAIIHALYETNMVAVVRRVYSAATTPRLGFLSPHIKDSYECLQYTELPFREDVRQFVFNPLPTNDEATSGKQFKPTADQLSAMDDLISQMDLTYEDEDGKNKEYLKPTEVFNPWLQRLYQCLQCRALNPDDLLPDVSDVIQNSLKPPQEVTAHCQEAQAKLKDLFQLEFIKPKPETEEQNVYKAVEDTEPPAKRMKMEVDLGTDLSSLTRGTVTEVGTVTPVEDFQTIISQKDADRFDEACRQMQARILQLITDSFGTQLYHKAMQCIRVMRAECSKNMESALFNHSLRTLKESLSTNSRNDFWQMIVSEKLTLISKMESEDSSVTKEEADAFLKAEVNRHEEPPVEEEADADDLLMQM